MPEERSPVILRPGVTMLIVLALSGLAAAFAAPIILSKEDDDDDPVSPIPGSEEEQQDLLEIALSSDAGVEAGSAFTLSAAPGDYEFEEFDPSEDVLHLEMPGDDATIEAGLSEDGIPEIIATLPGGEAMTLRFPNLPAVPGSAVEIVIPDTVDGPLTLSLDEVLDLGTIEENTPAETVFLLDGWGEYGDGVLDHPIDDTSSLFPLAPGVGEDIDASSDPLDDLLPVAPGAGDAVDLPPDPLPWSQPVTPNPGDDL